MPFGKPVDNQAPKTVALDEPALHFEDISSKTSWDELIRTERFHQNLVDAESVAERQAGGF